MPQRFTAFILLVVIFCLAHPSQLPAEPVRTESADLDKTDAKAFAVLFRRENEYVKTAKAALPDKPEAHLDRVLVDQFKLEQADANSLEKIAGDWAHDMQALRSEFLKSVAAFHGSFPNGRLAPGIDPTPPPILADLRGQAAKITIQYRDKLRNSMQESSFQELRTNVVKTYMARMYRQTPVTSAPNKEPNQ